MRTEWPKKRQKEAPPSLGTTLLKPWGRDIGRGKPLFRRKMGRKIPFQTRAWRIIELSPKNISDYDPNTNFNLWNFDLGFNWEFAPGSKATLLYRNNLFNQDNLSGISYYSSTKELFQKPINHQISLRINYFIDYNILRKKNK